MRSPFRFLLLLAVAAALVASAVDPYAHNSDPSHSHIVLGRTGLERARALASHLRGGHEDDLAFGVPIQVRHVGEDDGAKDDGARVLSIRPGDSAGVTVLGVGGGAILSTGRSAIPPAMAGGRTIAPSLVPVTEIDRLVPEPPPRAS